MRERRITSTRRASGGFSVDIAATSLPYETDWFGWCSFLVYSSGGVRVRDFRVMLTSSGSRVWGQTKEIRRDMEDAIPHSLPFFRSLLILYRNFSYLSTSWFVPRIFCGRYYGTKVEWQLWSIVETPTEKGRSIQTKKGQEVVACRFEHVNCPHRRMVGPASTREGQSGITGIKASNHRARIFVRQQ